MTIEIDNNAGAQMRAPAIFGLRIDVVPLVEGVVHPDQGRGDLGVEDLAVDAQGDRDVRVAEDHLGVAGWDSQVLSRVAAVRRRSWNTMRGRPAAVRIRSKERERFRGSTGRPLRVVKT